MLKICIIGMYYGKLPEWIDYWFRSCEQNSTIDFILVTDLDPLTYVPVNVSILHMTMQEVCRLAERKIGCRIVLEHPYKLCDLKPCYGKIMEDYLNGYDYWGHCDFDLIWGDIRFFTERYQIERYDKFLSLGHLSLYRNTEECNLYFKRDGSKCGDYRSILSSGKNYAFDETDGIFSIFKRHGLPMYTDRIFAEIKTFHKRFRLKFSDGNYRQQVFYFEKGKLFRAYSRGKKVRFDEFIYIHFRRNLPVSEEVNAANMDNFYITPSGFTEKQAGVPGLQDIKKYNPNPGMAAEGIETIRFCVKNIHKIIAKFINRQ